MRAIEPLKKATVAIGMIGAIAFPAEAQVTGSELLGLCTAPKGSANANLCGSYLLGAVDMVSTINETLDVKFVCFPEEGLSSDQLIELAQKYLTTHQTELEQKSAVLILDMLSTEYKCQT
jgi:hypothetical protein